MSWLSQGIVSDEWVLRSRAYLRLFALQMSLLLLCSLPPHSRYAMTVDKPLCQACERPLTLIVVWLRHRGGALCAFCADELLDHLYEYGQREFDKHGHRHGELLDERERRCAGECGRIVVDLRKRGQRVIACSTQCRRRYYNDFRRMDRRAKLPTLPPLHCAECGGELVVSRSDIRYCSTHCRVGAHRRRQRAKS